MRLTLEAANIEALFRDGLCLPSDSSLAEDDPERIVGAVRGCCRSGRTHSRVAAIP